MEARWPIVVGITAICGGIAWFALRTPASAPRGSRGPDAVATPGSAERPGKAMIGAPQPPTLAHAFPTPRPSLPEGSAAPDPGPEPATVAFEAQDRDATWAPRTESELRRRFTKFPGAHLDATECRQDQCLLVITGSQAELGKTIAAIDDPGGLHDFVQNILLTAPESKDGKLVLRAYAKFTR